MTRSPIASQPRGMEPFSKRALPVARGVLRHFSAHWWRYAVPAAALVLFQHFFWIQLNMTESLKGSVFLVMKWKHELKDFERGDYVAFWWHGGLRIPKGIVFVKIMEGKPGDVVTTSGPEGRTFAVNGVQVGRAKELARGGWTRLEAAQPGVIPAGQFFVRGTHPDSLDSRYRIAGLMSESAIVGKAILLW